MGAFNGIGEWDWNKCILHIFHNSVIKGFGKYYVTYGIGTRLGLEWSRSIYCTLQYVVY